MGSRSGDIDPGLLPFLSSMGMSVAEMDTMLNKQSGLLGLGGSVDIRPILDGAKLGDVNCKNAIEVFVHRVRKYLGDYMLQLEGKMDALVFSAGIGENSAEIRKRVCSGLEAFGIEIDLTANKRASGPASEISSPDSRIKVFVIATDEEAMIAQDTAALASRHVEQHVSRRCAPCTLMRTSFIALSVPWHVLQGVAALLSGHESPVFSPVANLWFCTTR